MGVRARTTPTRSRRGFGKLWLAPRDERSPQSDGLARLRIRRKPKSVRGKTYRVSASPAQILALLRESTSRGSVFGFSVADMAPRAFVGEVEPHKPVPAS